MIKESETESIANNKIKRDTMEIILLTNGKKYIFQKAVLNSSPRA